MILNMMSLHRRLIARAAQTAVKTLHTSSALRKNLYETLGLTRDATQADIKNAYFELSKMYHPDRIAATDENLAKFREISDAYEILGNEQSRKLYDRGLMGEIKRPGEEDTAEVVDPIIKFYKSRQETLKPKVTEDLEVWAEEYYKDAKKKSERRSQFYTVSRREGLENDRPFEDVLLLGIFMVIGFFFYTNYRGTKAEKAWRSWFESN